MRSSNAHRGEKAAIGICAEIVHRHLARRRRARREHSASVAGESRSDRGELAGGAAGGRVGVDGAMVGAAGARFVGRDLDSGLDDLRVGPHGCC